MRHQHPRTGPCCRVTLAGLCVLLASTGQLSSLPTANSSEPLPKSASQQSQHPTIEQHSLSPNHQVAVATKQKLQPNDALDRTNSIVFHDDDAARQHNMVHYQQARESSASGSGSHRNNNMDSWRRVAYFRMDPKTELKLSQVDGSLCSHIILAFARIDSEGNLTLDQEDDAKNYLSEIAEFKQKYQHVKMMISVFNEQTHNGFPRAARSEAIRRKFARSAIEFLQRYQLDGIDLDWEFPNFPQTIIVREYERQGFSKILRSLRSAIVENFYSRQVAQQEQQQHNSYHIAANNSGTIVSNNKLVEPYLLTVAIAGQDAVMSSSYELKEVANLCDWLNVMSYDYYQFKAYSPFTGPNSPLHPIVDPYVPIMSKLAHSWTYQRLIDEEGIERDKLVLGIPTYARAYRLMFRNTRPAPFTLSLGSKGGRIPDYLDYREVADILSRPDTVVEFDTRARVPYLLTDNGYTWVSFENEQSIREKVKFALEQRLGGYMTWNLNSDDFVGDHHSKIAAKQTSSPNHDQVRNIDIGQPAANGHLASTSSSQKLTTFPLHRAMFEEVIKFHSLLPKLRDDHNLNDINGNSKMIGSHSDSSSS